MANGHENEAIIERMAQGPRPEGASRKDLPDPIRRARMKPKRRLRFIAPVVALVLVVLVLWIPRRHAQLYRVTVLPSPGGTIVQPTAINDHGQIVGTAEGPAGQYHAFLWDRKNGLKDLSVGVCNDINNAAQIAGTMRGPNGSQQAFFWDPNDGRRMLCSLGVAGSAAVALNSKGQVVGTLYPDLNRPPGTSLAIRKAFIWDKTRGMRELVPSGQRTSLALRINDAGQVMGSIGDYKSARAPAPCFWDSTDPVVAPPLESSIDYPAGSDLNNHGYVVGTAYHWGKDEQWVFLWKKETGIEGMKYLFPLEHSLGPMRVNDANQVLYGEKHISPLERISRKYFGPRTQYCLWDPKRGKIVLDKQVPRDTGKLLRVAAINNRGCIVGVIQSKGLGQEYVVLLEPIPERWDK